MTTKQSSKISSENVNVRHPETRCGAKQMWRAVWREQGMWWPRGAKTREESGMGWKHSFSRSRKMLTPDSEQVMEKPIPTCDSQSCYCFSIICQISWMFSCEQPIANDSSFPIMFIPCDKFPPPGLSLCPEIILSVTNLVMESGR